MAIDRLPSGRFRGRLMIDRHSYAAKWLAGFLDDAPDRARFEAALEHRLLPVLGALPLLEVLDGDRDELHHRVGDTGGSGDDGDPRECLELVLDEAIHELRVGTLDVLLLGEVPLRGVVGM